MTGDRSLVAHLSKGLGLRCPDLILRVPRAFRPQWGIEDTDLPDDIRVKVIWQVERALSTLTPRESELWSVAALALNFGDYGTTVKNLNLSERRRKHPLLSERTVLRRMDALDAELSERLSRSTARPSEPELCPIRDREAEQPPPPTGASLEKLIPALHGRCWDTVTGEFLNSLFHAPLGPSGAFVLGTTRTRGKWAFAFTRPELLIAYQQVTQPNWVERTTVVTGADLVKRIHRASYYVGLLVNPPPTKGAEFAQTLGISALEIAKLTIALEKGPA